MCGSASFRSAQSATDFAVCGENSMWPPGVAKWGNAREATPAQPAQSELVDRDLEITDAVVFRLRHVPGAHVHLHRWQHERGHIDRGIARGAHGNELFFAYAINFTNSDNFNIREEMIELRSIEGKVAPRIKDVAEDTPGFSCK